MSARAITALTLRTGVGRALRAAAVAVLALDCVHQAKADSDDFTRIQRSRYLATLGDCVACHTGKDGAPYAGGLLLQTPFGAISAPNITLDPDTGIGRWGENQFITTMQTGIAPGGTHLVRPFPIRILVGSAAVIWQTYTPICVRCRRCATW